MRDLCTKNSDRGRGGVKNPENYADVICTWPLTRRVNYIPSVNHVSIGWSSISFYSVPTKQDSGDSDGNRILQDRKQKLLQDSEAPDYHFYQELLLNKELLLKKELLLNPDLLFL